MEIELALKVPGSYICLKMADVLMALLSIIVIDNQDAILITSVVQLGQFCFLAT